MFRNNSVFQVGSRFRCNTTIIPGNPRGKKKPGEQLLQCSMETARLERKQKNKNWHQHHFSRVCSSRPRVWELGLDWRRVRSLRGGRLGRGRWSSKESRWPCSWFSTSFNHLIHQVGGKVGRTGGASLLSPPLHASLYPPAAQPQPEGLPSPDQGGGGHQEDEWKNIQVLLGCLKNQTSWSQFVTADLPRWCWTAFWGWWRRHRALWRSCNNASQRQPTWEPLRRLLLMCRCPTSPLSSWQRQNKLLSGSSKLGDHGSEAGCHGGDPRCQSFCNEWSSRSSGGGREGGGPGGYF